MPRPAQFAALLALRPSGCRGAEVRTGPAGAPRPRRSRRRPRRARPPSASPRTTRTCSGRRAPRRRRRPPRSSPRAGSSRALHPRYLRLLIDWAQLQPSQAAPADLEQPVDGCARGVPPCGSYPGVAGELEAIASQQRAARGRGEAEPQVVVDMLGTPSWAALPAHGCEAPGTPPTARGPRPDALPAYRALIARAARPRQPRRASACSGGRLGTSRTTRASSAPQRARCTTSGTPLATDAYAELARAMAAELQAAGTGARMLLGELGGYLRGSPHRLARRRVRGGPARRRAVPERATGRSTPTRPTDPARERPKARTPSSRSSARSTRAAAVPRAPASGSPRRAPARRDPGRPRAGTADEEAGRQTRRSGASSMRWSSDPRVAAVFQYSFREDPAYPIGLIESELSDRLYGTHSVRHLRSPQSTLRALVEADVGARTRIPWYWWSNTPALERVRTSAPRRPVVWLASQQMLLLCRATRAVDVRFGPVLRSPAT